ncbi:MAG: type IV pilus twitching motility protein PilT [Candidatus Sumerlaeia bacterium]
MNPEEPRNSHTIGKFISMLHQAVKVNASDLHLRSGCPPRVRINGVLMDFTREIIVESDLKEFCFEMLNRQQLQRFEESWELDYAYSIENVCRMRINLFLQQGKFCAAIRLLPEKVPTMEEIYLPKAAYSFTRLDKGLVLVTGPTGSGKSTTLAAMIDQINAERGCHIMTIEDPIEFIFSEKKATISQREVTKDTQSFQAALRHCFRQDPDVVMIGEMRDYETMQAAIRLAETGHLTFSTLHTSSAAQTVSRIIDSFPPHQQNQVRAQLAVSLEGVISQRLIPLKSGKGRVAAREVMVCTSGIRNLIRENKIHQINSAIQTGLDVGMIRLNHSLGHLLENGYISYQDALHSADDKSDFAQKYGGRSA